MASAKAPTNAARAKPPGKSVAAGVPWVMSQTFKLPDLSVQVGRNVVNPTYRVTLANGETIDLAPTVPVSLSGLSKQDVAEAASETRIILESILRLMMSSVKPASGLINGQYAQGAVVDPKWLTRNRVRLFDPVTTVFEDRPLGSRYANVLSSEEARAFDEREARAISLRASRMGKVFSFVRDAVYTSTIEAFRNNRVGHNKMKTQVQEWGIQFAFRGEIQVGMGKLNITKNFPVIFSFGYNKTKRTLFFRRGFRTESMAEGTAFSVGVKFELRYYRLVTDDVYAADARDGFAKVRGQSWYPPSMLPIISPVMDTAPGYQSYGLAVGLNLADFVPGTFLLNTVTSFQEQQRVYSAPLPEPAQWMKKFQMQMEDSASLFGGASIGGRCEQLFIPTVGSF